VASDSQEEKQLLIYNQSGQLQYQLPVHLTPGENLIALPKSFAAGQYNVVVRGEKGIEKRGSWVVVD
jgi:hypothetical protein